MRQRELLEFRTPQHPSSLGHNNWGGASPLLARNVPKESIEQRYLRLNTIRDRDQIFPSTTIEEEIFSTPQNTIGGEIFSFSKNADVATLSRKGMFRKLMWRPRRRSATLGLSSGSKWFPRLNSKKKWPNGWC